MAKTSAERQAAYREKNRKGIAGANERIDCMVSADTKRALEHLAKSENVTLRTKLEELIFDAYKERYGTLSSPAIIVPSKPHSNIYEDTSWR